jgi:error-prone DNA polymerase
MDDLVAYGEGLIAILVPDEADDTCALQLRRLREVFGDRAYLALTLAPAPQRPAPPARAGERWRRNARVPTVVTNDVLFHEPGAPHPAGCRDRPFATTSPSMAPAIAANVMPTAI